MVNKMNIEAALVNAMHQESTIRRPSLKGLSEPELQTWCIRQGESRFRGTQLFEWLYKHGLSDPVKMVNIRKSFRDHLSENYIFQTLSMVHISSSQHEPTQKFLFRTRDDLFIESVSIIDGRRHTVCLSAQVGCNVGCDFCATGHMGLSRNLTAGEIVDQLIHVRAQVQQPISNVVFMGMGEPFLNYTNVITASDIFHHQRGFGLASNRITISTAGILPKIEQFIREHRKFKLAISLNAADDPTRLRLMPINQKWGIHDLIRAGRAYSELPGRQVMFEYVLLQGVNDSPEDAQRLARLLKGIDCKVNIIPFNASGGVYHRPPEQTVNDFARILTDYRDIYRVLVRRSKGIDIEAACGQLATRSHAEIASASV